jgi:poly(3-hydroxybutyrate) depolymerase
MRKTRTLSPLSYLGLCSALLLINAHAAPAKAPAASPGATISTQAGQTGLLPSLPLDTRAFKTFRDYYATSVQRKVLTAYKTRKGMGSFPVNKLTPEQCHAYEDGQTTIVYVPASYDGAEPYGVYLHNSPSQQGIRPPKPWQDLMDKLKLIYISPNGGGNDAADLRRVVLALDSLASVKHQYKINEERVYVGGLSGGGYVGMLCQMFYPELFHGAISHAAQSYLPAGTKSGHFAGLALADLKSSPRNQRKWVVISGDKDKNYREIIDTSKDWVHAHFQYKFIDVPGMGHQNASEEALEEALTWIGAGNGVPAQRALQPAAVTKENPEAKTAEDDPQAVIITADSKKAHKTGPWQESGTIRFQGRPTVFTRQAGATTKFRLEFKGASRAAISIFRAADGQRYGDPHMKISVAHKGKEEAFDVDCTKGEEGWMELGVFDFSGNGSEYVLVTRVSPDSENIATRAIAVKSKLVPLTAGAK